MNFKMASLWVIGYMLLLTLSFLGAYFLGAIPFSFIVSKLKGIDLTKVGSGNFGATNVYRAMGIKFALLVFTLDLLKALAPTLLAIHYFPGQYTLHILIGFTAVLGHSLSVFLKFKGGKGVASGVGVLIGISPVVGLSMLALGVSLIVAFRYVAPVSILCCVLTPILFYLTGAPEPYFVSVTVICSFIIVRHRANIVRLLKGQENKV